MTEPYSCIAVSLPSTIRAKNYLVEYRDVQYEIVDSFS
jgi:hypothetical protein